MKNYTEVCDQSDLDALLERCNGFHDAHAKEFAMVNRAWVDESRRRYMKDGYDLRLFIQSQGPPFGIELLFIGVKSLSVGEATDFFSASGHVRESKGLVESREILMELGRDLEVCSARLFFRERSEWLGPQAFMGQDVPAAEMAPAAHLADDWWQCSACSESYQAQVGAEVAVCPTCHITNELDLPETQESSAGQSP